MHVDTSVLIERIDVPSPSVALSPPFTDSGRHATWIGPTSPDGISTPAATGHSVTDGDPS